MMPPIRLSRRQVLGAALGIAATAAGGPVGAALAPTPPQTAGPFYPRTKPLDSDADLVHVGGRGDRAKGTVTHVFGRIADLEGRPLPGARIEIWQCDAFGRYHHPFDGGGGDPNFQGYGRAAADADGTYRFRTIRPVPYPGRAPHIHFRVSAGDDPLLTTQMYVEGDPLNDRDFLLSRIGDPADRARLMVALRPAPEVEADALAGRFDLVIARS
jgi:protocatechuate 3,4-dioxygenase beta subunit